MTDGIGGMNEVDVRGRVLAMWKKLVGVKDDLLRSFALSAPARADTPDDAVASLAPAFVSYTDLPDEESALRTLDFPQKIFGGLLLLLVLWAFVVDWRLTLIILVAAVSVFYLLHFFFTLFLVTRSFHSEHEVVVSKEAVRDLNAATLPVYTILCPLYKEWRVLPQFLEAIERLEWPKEKLDVALLLEADDEETLSHIQRLDLPAHFRVLVVPPSTPQTKPKACNYGLRHASGEFVVIYDAEDIPEPDQLKKAYLVFQATAGQNVVCAQAKLDFYNVHQNLLTRLFAIEYALWFDLILTGLQSGKFPIPLGGTSNHFRTRDLHQLNGWDVFNVTEDCDLGMRIAKRGQSTVMFNSSTFEEANSSLGNWIRQRSRWIKGYLQTYLVHMRRPEQFIRRSGWRAFLAFQLVIGGKILALALNPLFWLMTIAYIVLRPLVGPTIESFYPLPVLYMSVFSLTLGNFLYFYYSILGCIKRGEFSLVKYVLAVPFYWLLMSYAFWKGFYQLIVKPHYWEKTVHGLHLPAPVAPAPSPARAFESTTE